MFLPAVVGISFAGFIALAISLSREGQHELPRSSLVKRGYIYLVSFITLLIVGLAAITLVELGLRNLVFTKAAPTTGYGFVEPPPTLYISSEKIATAPAPTSGLTCENGCSLTDQQKQDITSWQENYRQWKARQSPTGRIAQSLVNPLSFLIVAGIIFFFHWRMVLRDRRRLEESKNLTWATYFSAMSFIWLITIVFAGGFLLNTVLRSVLPGAETSTGGVTPTSISAVDRAGVTSLVTCGQACGLSEETRAAAQEWQNDYQTWQQSQPTGTDRDRHNRLANQMAFVVVALPLFWYHFRTAWREKKQPPTQVV